MLAQISFALNRVYTGYYRTRGYDFDITNSTQYDQYFVNGRDVFENIQQLAAELFNTYIRRVGNVEPLFAQYCNGTTVTCNGMSQWGSVDLARAGYTPYRIPRLPTTAPTELVRNAPVGTVQNTAPTSPLRLGSANNDVRLLQIRLNRISNNYPNIPKIPYVNGIFADATENAVREFQKTFNLAQDGIVGSATWFAVERIYAAVKQLNSPESEGLTFNEVSNQFPGVLRRGDANTGVSLLQYYLDFLSVYYDGIPSIAVDGIFGEDTENAVYAAQSVSDRRWTDWWASRRGRLSWTLTSASSKPSRSGIPRATPSRSRGLFCVRATNPKSCVSCRSTELHRCLHSGGAVHQPDRILWIADAGVCGSNPACLRTAGYGLCQRHHLAVYYRSVQRFVCREPLESRGSIRLHGRLIARKGISAMTQHPNASNAIREMQRCSRALSCTDPAIPPPPVDGVSGNATRASVAAFVRSTVCP